MYASLNDGDTFRYTHTHTLWLHIPEGVCPSLFLYFKIETFNAKIGKTSDRELMWPAVEYP